jgi:hypothetical protein
VVNNSGLVVATRDDGVGIFAGGTVTNTAHGTISGLGTLGAGVFITGGAGLISNSGTVAGNNHFGVLISATGSIDNAASGLISGYAAGVFTNLGVGTVTNRGSINATGTNGAGVYVENGGMVTNSVSGHKFGVFLEGAAGTLTNAGRISAATYDGVVLGLGGTVTNQVGASIIGDSIGVYAKYRALADVTNSGSISATAANGAGVDLADGGNVSNAAAGLISGTLFGVFVAQAKGAVTNTGHISGGKYDRIVLEAGGTVTNAAGASVTGGSNGVYVGAGGAVTNSGSITAQGAGADLQGGGSFVNGASASVAGGSFGVFVSGAPGTVTNDGTLSGSHGVALEAGGTLDNGMSGAIQGQVSGVLVQSGAASLTNAGTITGSAAGGAGADIEAGGALTNATGASITGSTFGVFLSGGNGTVVNDGTIAGGSYAVDFSGAGTNRLVVEPNAVFLGAVGGGSAANSTLELAGGAGTLSNLSGSAGTVAEGGNAWQFYQFGALAVDAGGTWTASGVNSTAVLANDGQIVIAGSLDVSTALASGSTGLFQIDTGATLEVASAPGTAAKMNFLAGSDLIVDSAASFGVNVGTPSYAGPQLQNFIAGATVDLKNFSIVGATTVYDATSGILQITNGASQAASLSFQTSSLGGGSFQSVADGAGGILITRS